MMKKTYIKPTIKVRALQTRPIMNVGSYRQEPINGDTSGTDDDTDYWGY